MKSDDDLKARGIAAANKAFGPEAKEELKKKLSDTLPKIEVVDETKKKKGLFACFFEGFREGLFGRTKN